MSLTDPYLVGPYLKSQCFNCGSDDVYYQWGAVSDHRGYKVVRFSGHAPSVAYVRYCKPCGIARWATAKLMNERWFWIERL